jgi:molecular chaperone GrpE
MSEKKDRKHREKKEDLKETKAVADETEAGESGDGPDAGTGDDAQDEASGIEAPAETVDQEDADARYMRLAADFQNFRKRTEKEKSDIYAYANEKFAMDLLEVLDNFERAIGQDATEGADAKFIEGMEMIQTQLVNVLKRNDVEEISALGEEFDPNQHHAVLMEPSGDYESGRVTDVMQKGYRLRDKVIRPSMVRVAQ